MGLIVEDIEVELSSSNIKHYTSLGYIIPKRKNAVGKLTTPRGTKIKVKSFDLQRGSSEFIHIKCDLCGQILTQHYYQYSYRKHEKTFVIVINVLLQCLLQVKIVENGILQFH